VNGTVAAPESARDPFVVCDVALFYAARSGGIRTYLNEKARFAAATRAFEHHLVVPGKRERHDAGRHELRSLQVAASNGYRVPIGARAVRATLQAVQPDVVILHDPFWRPLSVTREAHRLGAAVVAAHHASPALHAAGIPGPDAFYLPALRRMAEKVTPGPNIVTPGRRTVTQGRPNGDAAAGIGEKYGLSSRKALLFFNTSAGAPCRVALAPC
jgi:hypothetical protein